MVQTLGSLSKEEKKKHLKALESVLTDDDKDIDLDNIEVEDDIEPVVQEMDDKMMMAALAVATMPAPTRQIGPNGVMQIYKAKEGGPAYYLGEDFERDKIQITYGSTIVKYTTRKWNNITVYKSAGWPVTYKSGNPPSRSIRINTYPIGGIKANKTKFDWQNNPGYLYKENGPKNTMFTIYVKPSGRLNTHEACAGKKAGREEDERRSLAEFVWPTKTHNTPQFNWNYAHFPYVNGKGVKIFKKAPVIETDKWVGISYIHKAAVPGKTAGHWELWGDINPFSDNGEILNNWELFATFDDFGCKEYKNIPVGWAYMRDVFRGDGFKFWEFCLLSDVEFDTEEIVQPPVDPVPTTEMQKLIDYFTKHPDKIQEFVEKLTRLIPVVVVPTREVPPTTIQPPAA